MSIATKYKPGFIGPKDKAKLDAISLNPSEIAGIEPTLDLEFTSADSVPSSVEFTRTSIATYYDDHSTAKAEENLLTYSNLDVTTDWGVTEGQREVVANTAPDGSANSMLISEAATSGTGQSARLYQEFYYVAGDWSYSVYLKKGTTQYAYITMRVTSLGIVAATFDLNAGTLSFTNSYLTWSNVSGSISDAGNGWYRCEIKGNLGDSSSGFVFIGPSDGTAIGTGGYVASLTYTGRTLYAWGAQLEQRDSVTAYTPTTDKPITNYIPVMKTAQPNEPRIDFDPVTRECKGLLIEKSSTNLVLYSSNFELGWSILGSSIISNTIIAPDGTLTGSKLIENTATGLHEIQINWGSANLNDIRTGSIYVKAGERTKVGIRVGRSEPNEIAFIDLANQSIISQGSNIERLSITGVGNDWYRISITVSIAITSPSQYLKIILMKESSNYTGDGYSGIYVWGAQVEASGSATGYIPTNGSTEIRTGERLSIQKDLYDFLANDEGTFYVEHTNEKGVVSDPANVLSGLLHLSANIANNQHGFAIMVGDDINRYQLWTRTYTNISTATIDGYARFNGVNRIVGSYSIYNSKIKISVQGSPVDEAFYYDFPLDFQALSFGYKSISGASTNDQQIDSHIKRVTYWPKMLTNEKLIELTKP